MPEIVEKFVEKLKCWFDAYQVSELLCFRAELYDVLVNVESKEIAIAAHAKGK